MLKRKDYTVSIIQFSSVTKYLSMSLIYKISCFSCSKFIFFLSFFFFLSSFFLSFSLLCLSQSVFVSLSSHANTHTHKQPCPREELPFICLTRLLPVVTNMLSFWIRLMGFSWHTPNQSLLIIPSAGNDHAHSFTGEVWDLQIQLLIKEKKMSFCLSL